VADTAYLSYQEQGELLYESDLRSARFETVRRRRFISSVREVIDAEGLQVVSNEVFEPGSDLRARPGAPFRSATLEELVAHGYEPFLPRDEARTWS
jgi:hypothetical protein